MKGAQRQSAPLSAPWKNSLRSIWRTKRRFAAILLMVLLGTLIFIGLSLTAPNMRRGLNDAIRAGRREDLRISSPMGLYEADRQLVDALSDVTATAYRFTDDYFMDGEATVIRLLSLTDTLSAPILAEGRLPEARNELLLDRRAQASGYKLGDVVRLSAPSRTEPETNALASATFKIVGFGSHIDFMSGISSGITLLGDGALDYFAVADRSAFLKQRPDEVLLRFGALDALSPGDPEYRNIAAKLSDELTERFRHRPEDLFIDLSEAAWRRIEDAKQEIADAEAKLAEGKQALDKARAELDAGHREHDKNRRALETLSAQFGQTDARAQEALDAAREALMRGEADYANGKAAYETKAAHARERIDAAKVEISDAEAAISAIRIPPYTVSGQSNDPVLAGMIEGADNMGALTFIFSPIFYLIAMLVTYTTMTRMVEEERVQIGMLKALGYTQRPIAAKYLLYAGLSSLLGTIGGIAMGYFTLMPIIYDAYFFSVNLIVPKVYGFYLLPAVISLLIGVGITLFAAWYAVRRTLKETAASLMRPKAPERGNRILIERLPTLWRRLGFLSKIALRNLTAKKSRLMMTLFGITGCTGLIVMAFGLRFSIENTVAKQYGILSRYDLQVILDPDAPTADIDSLDSDIARISTASAAFHRSTGTFRDTEALTTNFTLIVPEKADAFSAFQALYAPGMRKGLTLNAQSVLISRRFADAIGHTGSGIRFRDGDGIDRSITPSAVFESFVGHTLILSSERYADLFDRPAIPNARYLHLKPEIAVADAKADLLRNDAVHLVISQADAKAQVDELINAMNIVVAAIVLISCLLAFIVLFNLTNLNVAERLRELSTIKVLGFTDFELTRYIYRETVMLAAIGILLGFVIGRSLHLAICLAMSPKWFLIDPKLPLSAYLSGLLIPIGFTLVVMCFVHRRLKRVNMVEALKSED